MVVSGDVARLRIGGSGVENRWSGTCADRHFVGSASVLVS